MAAKTKILFDGNCYICDFEISHYKRKAPDLFELIDISSPEFKAEDYHLTPEAVNYEMHVITPDGQLKIGVDAFSHIWSRFKEYKLASRLIMAPIIHPLAKIGYTLFATIRPYLPKKNR